MEGMAREGVASEGTPVAAVVVRGRDLASLASVVRRTLSPAGGRAVVCARLSAPSPASADIIHAVVDGLIDSGCREVTVGTMLRSRDRDRGHRSVSGLAHLAGLTGRTPRGRTYDVADLADDTIAAPVPATSVLDGQRVSRLWAVTDTRVVVGRAVTDLLESYAGCLDTLAGTCVEVPGAEAADVVVGLLRALPPALSVVDATVTSDGADGARLPHPTATDTVVVSTDALLADCTLAALLGDDRSSSRLIGRALAELGTPTGPVDGDLTPFEGISRAHPLARAAARRSTAGHRLERVLLAAVGGPDEGALPPDPVLSAVRAVLTPAVAAAADPVGQAALVGLLAAIGSATEAGRGWAVGLDKDRVERRVVPLGFDPADHANEAYDGLPGFFAPFDAVIDALPDPGPEDMRWCLVDGATVFEVSRDIAAGFDDFVARVDVAAGISLMADYIGGRRVQVGPPDQQTRPGAVIPTRQAERNLYLPQPNYLAVWGGEPIDVCKIELVEREPDEHRLRWRTVDSPNGSATYDDGTLTFTRTSAGVRATVRGRQLFTLPPAWATVDLTAMPEVRAPLLEEAYRRFFTTTFDNLEACYEGREFRIGRPAPDPDEPLVTQTLQMLLDAAAEWVQSRADPTSERSREASHRPSRGSTHDSEPEELDVHGFRHKRGGR